MVGEEDQGSAFRQEEAEMSMELSVIGAGNWGTTIANMLAEKGYNPDYGARPLRRVVQDYIEDVLSEGLLSGRFREGDVVEVDLAEDGQELVFEVKERREEVTEVPDAYREITPLLG